MQFSLKRWLTNGHWFGSRDGVTKQSLSTHANDYAQMALALSCTEDIQRTLTQQLPQLENDLNASLPKQNVARLIVLLSHRSSNESTLYSGQMEMLNSELSQAAHQNLTLSEVPRPTPIKLLSSGGQLLPIKLFEDDSRTAWLLYLFNHELPNQQQFKWSTRSIENVLSDGLKAWSQNEAKVTSALENERAIYAAELHDSVAQVLGYLKLKSSKLDKLCQSPPHQSLKPLAEDLMTYTHCAYHQTRELIVSSRLSLQSDNLSQAISRSIEEYENQSAIVFELDNRLPSLSLTPTEAMQTLYIVRESLSNIVRHSHASHANVTLFMQDHVLNVLIEDNGLGVEATVARSDSFGLQIMHERAQRIGAKLSIRNIPSGGTRVSLHIQTSCQR